MFKKNKYLMAVRFLAVMYFLMIFTVTAPAQGVIPSLGNGSCEVILFADYFCPPCRMIDLKAEPLFKELLATGKVRITFVDVPFSRATPMYLKYYLYAVNANADAKNIFQVRRILFDAAQVNRIQTEDALVAHLKAQKVLWKAMNEKSIYPLLNAMMKEHKVDATPTCVIKYSVKDVKRFVGSDEIWNGLTQLKAHLAIAKK
jgi:protein-disulfide isomerase